MKTVFLFLNFHCLIFIPDPVYSIRRYTANKIRYREKEFFMETSPQNKMEILQNFYHPPRQYRGMPFWAWNGTLKKEELIRQIHVMHEMGLGGFFMHSRTGLVTPYMGEEFMECVKTCIEEAERLGMKACLYDEDRWPSGSAGGQVTKTPLFRSRFLYCREVIPGAEVEKMAPEDPLLALFRLHYKGGKLLSYERVKEPPAQLAGGDLLYGFYRGIAPDHSWFNDQAYVDTLNPEAVRQFILCTHERYFKQFSAYFGNTVPWIFSDEPSFREFIPQEAVAWTDALPEKFKEIYSFDLLDHLPELFFDCGNKVSRVRYCFHNLRNKLFTDSFCAQIGQWCAEHNIAMTGHVLAEDTLSSQVKCVGSAMRSYEHMQIPGIDLLTEHWQILNTLKQCVSVARQCGKKLRLSETYGCTGWDFPFMGHKALGDWQYALGINVRCLHLAWYTMEGEAKRDYPSSISFQASWHKIYPVVEDYFARLSAVLSGGEEIRDLLVIHPMESCFAAAYKTNDRGFLYQVDLDFAKNTVRLLTDNIDFDFGDEEMMSRLAFLQDGSLYVGKGVYKMVLIPELFTIRKTTLDLLEAFADKGGTVLYMGNIPDFMDALPSAEPARIYKKFETVTDNYFREKLFAREKRRLAITADSGEQTRTTLARLAKLDEKNYTLFICNTGAEFTSHWQEAPFVRERNIAYENTRITVTLPPGSSVYRMDASSGKIHSVPFEYRDGQYLFQASFAPLESHLYWIGQEIPEALPPVPRYREECFHRTLPGGKWAVTLTGPNSLVLDHAHLFLDGKKVLDNTFFIVIDDFLRKTLGKRPRSGLMVQPYLQDNAPPERILQMELHYSFRCATVPEKECLLALERPELYDRILLNGNTLDPRSVSWWIDPSLQTLRVPISLLQTGENELILQGKYHEKLPGLESLFLLGDFGVKEETVTGKVQALSMGDWTLQGLEEYASDVIYHHPFTTPELQKDEHLFLSIPKWRGVSLGIRINSSGEIPVYAPPFELDITGFLAGKENTLSIRVYGSARNAFGPFFTGQKWQTWTGPNQFKAYNSSVRQIVPSGILESPVLRIRKEE